LILRQWKWEIQKYVWRKNNNSADAFNFNGGDKYMIAETDAAYIAGIIDGEGHIECVRRKEKRKGKTGDYFSNSMRICIRVQMTDKSVLLWMKEVIGMGTVRKRNRSASIKSHWKDSWVYSIRFREAYQLCCLIWPFAHVKLDKIQQIIDHYNTGAFSNVVDLTEYKVAKELKV